DTLEEALSIVPTDTNVVRVDLIAKRAETRRRAGQPFASRLQLEQALRVHQGPDDASIHALRLELAMDRLWHGDFARVRELAGQVRPAAREAGDGLLLCLAASLESLACSYLRESESAAEVLREAESAFADLPDERLAERVYLNHYISEAALRLERAEEALAH